MEFRIVPLLFAAFNLLFLISKIAVFFSDNTLPSFKQIGIATVLILVAYGAYKGHHYLSNNYKIIFWTLQIISTICVVFLFLKLQ
jgi:uncharacterized membrane protein